MWDQGFFSRKQTVYVVLLILTLGLLYMSSTVIFMALPIFILLSGAGVIVGIYADDEYDIVFCLVVLIGSTILLFSSNSYPLYLENNPIGQKLQDAWAGAMSSAGDWGGNP